MQPLGWLLVSLVGFGLLQVLLYRHFGRREPTPGSSRGASVTGDTPASGPPVVECRHCGSHNEAHRTVRYCRTCVEPLE
ncbi:MULTISPECIES: DUF7577 domain-containing protein [Haloarcula]|uniref:DUF7577 domain-containing protein n=1 Tax=Haloarcula TaxID=2237 RepID=UPI0023EBE488|nr:hypothetical protein [Halomicroarcula sp. XH51]